VLPQLQVQGSQQIPAQTRTRFNWQKTDSARLSTAEGRRLYKLPEGWAGVCRSDEQALFQSLFRAKA